MSLMVFRGREVILNSKSVVERKQKRLCDQSTCLKTQWAAVTAHCWLMVEAQQRWVPLNSSDNCDIEMEWAASLHFGTFLPQKPSLRSWHFLESLVLFCPCIAHDYSLLVTKNANTNMKLRDSLEQMKVTPLYGGWNIVLLAKDLSINKQIFLPIQI